MSLWETFSKLPRPSSVGSYSVECGPGRVRAARSYDNYPAVLIAFGSAASGAAPRRLATIAYTPPMLIELAAADGSHEQARLATLECRSSDPELGAYFYRVVAALVLDIVGNGDEAAFETALDALITLCNRSRRSCELTACSQMLG